MADYTASFLSSLEKAKEEFKKADNDLHTVINDVSNGLSKATKGKLELKLSLEDESDDGNVYQLVVQMKDDFKIVGAFLVTSKG